MKKIAVFAGAKCSKEKEPYYFEIAYRTGKLLAQAGFVTVTGAGPGLMDQTLKGAYENGGDTFGVVLNKEGRVHSSYFKNSFMFDKLGPRQDKLIEICDAYLAVPGGVGTLYEVSAILALKRAGELSLTKPLIMIGEYFAPLKNLLIEMEKEGFVDPALYSIFQIVQTPEEAVNSLLKDL